MIPFVQIPVLSLWDGRLTFTMFGLLVAMAVLVGSFFTIRRARVLGLPEERVHNMIFTTVLFGLIAAHVLDIIFYQEGPWDIKRIKLLLDPRQGLSSMGGFVGAVVALVVWCRLTKQRILPYADSLAYGLAFGWIFGRLGCYTAHDHPGLATSSPLAVAWPCYLNHPFLKTGFHFLTSATHDLPICPRYDLGLLEAFLAMGIALFFGIASRFRPRMGFFVASIATLYGPIRFLMDYLRAPAAQGGDRRLWGNLTPAQYAAMGITLAGLLLWVHFFRQPSSVPPPQMGVLAKRPRKKK